MNDNNIIYDISENDKSNYEKSKTLNNEKKISELSLSLSKQNIDMIYTLERKNSLISNYSNDYYTNSFENSPIGYNLTDIDNAYASRIDYSINYNVKQLGKILDYYEIPKKNSRKNEMIEIIIHFENDPNNYFIFARRKKLWKYLYELKSDKYFSKELSLISI